MPTTTEIINSLNASAARADTSSRQLYDVANGPASGTGSTVPTDGGAVPTLSKWFADNQASIDSQANLRGSLAEVSVFEFIDAALIPDIRRFESTVDLTSALNAAFPQLNGRRLVFPAGRYVHSGTLIIPKGVHIEIEGEFASYDGNEGTVIQYTGSGVGIQFGQDDGNPDDTGPQRACRLARVHLTTATGATSVRVQNTALFEMTRCVLRGASGKVVDLRGNVITRIRRNDISGSQPASGNVGIWCDDQYFGNYILDIEYNHIYQLNHAGRFSEGRSLCVNRNIVENIRPGDSGGVWKFETSGYISVASFTRNYYENHRGYIYEGAGFTGAILSLTIKMEDGWGSGDASHINPGVGALPRTKVFNQDISGNLFVNSSLNSTAALTMPSVYSSTSVFDESTTAIRSQPPAEDYQKALAYQLKPSDLLKSLGDFSIVTGGAPGSLTVNGSSRPAIVGTATSAPEGWTAAGVITGAVWSAVLDQVTGGWVGYCPGSGSTFNLATLNVALTPVAPERYFVLGVTFKGWAAIKVGASSVFDSGANVPNYQTSVVKFAVAPGASSIPLTIATNGANPSYWAEMRLYEIGVAEFVEPGATDSALTGAVARLMRRGAY